jgi:glucokinase
MTVIGIDVGGTKVSAALFSGDGRILARESSELAGRGGGDAGALVAALGSQLAGSAPSGSTVGAVGVAVPGIYRAGTKTVWAPNVPGWDDYPLVAELEAALPTLTIRVDSDRACAVLGEAWMGRARGARNVVFLVVGTGIGAGILAEGQIVRGADDAAGAVGWLGLDRTYRSGYASVGCFEYHASGTGLARAAQELARTDHAYEGPLQPADAGSITARDVFAAYEAGDPVASQVIDEAVAYWGMAVANLVSVFNPETIVFGGGIFGPAARFLDRIREEATRWAQPISMARVRLEVTALGDDAVLYGAGGLALMEPPATEA